MCKPGQADIVGLCPWWGEAAEGYISQAAPQNLRNNTEVNIENNILLKGNLEGSEEGRWKMWEGRRVAKAGLQVYGNHLEVSSEVTRWQDSFRPVVS